MASSLVVLISVPLVNCKEEQVCFPIWLFSILVLHEFFKLTSVCWQSNHQNLVLYLWRFSLTLWKVSLRLLIFLLEVNNWVQFIHCFYIFWFILDVSCKKTFRGGNWWSRSRWRTRSCNGTYKVIFLCGNFCWSFADFLCFNIRLVMHVFLLPMHNLDCQNFNLEYFLDLEVSTLCLSSYFIFIFSWIYHQLRWHKC